MTRIAQAALLLLTLTGLVQAQEPLPELFERINSSVLTIKAVEKNPVPGAKKKRNTNLGAGVLITHDGLVMTASHIVNLADLIAVETVAGEVISARVIANSDSADVALLQLDSLPQNIQPADLGDASQARIGEQVLVIGSPLGLEHSLSVGYLTGRHRPEPLQGFNGTVEFLQTDAAINPGNSGGPLFDRSGQLLGIVSHIRTETGGNQGLGFATTINSAREVLLEQPAEWRGIEVLMISGEMAAALNVPQYGALLVQRVARNSPAFFMGLRQGQIPAKIEGRNLLLGGDIILKIQGEQITGDFRVDGPRVQTRLRNLNAKESLELEILRGGERLTLFSSPEANPLSEVP